jgi:thioredoxin 2
VIRTCPHCGAKNRVPAAKLAVEGRCGACKQALPALAEPLDVDDEQFREIVASAPVPILVDFWAAWCGPCRMAAPHVERVANEMQGRALVLKVDTEAHPALAGAYGVRSIPNFVVLRGGSVVRQEAGLADPRQLRSWLEAS